jgi:hypothetical protein
VPVLYEVRKTLCCKIFLHQMTAILLVITFKGSSPCSQKLASRSTAEQQLPSYFSPRYYPPTSFYRTRWRIFLIMRVIISLLKVTSRVLDVAATAFNAMVFNLFCAMDPFQSLVKPTNPFSEKCIYMHELEISESYCS